MFNKLMSKEVGFVWVRARKLRLLVGVLLAANLLLAAWHYFYGGLSSEREPQRVLQQHLPETVKVVPAAEADRVRAPAVGPAQPLVPPAPAPAASAPAGPTPAGSTPAGPTPAAPAASTPTMSGPTAAG